MYSTSYILPRICKIGRRQNKSCFKTPIVESVSKVPDKNYVAKTEASV